MRIGSVDERHFRLYAAKRGSCPRIEVTAVWPAIVLLACDLPTWTQTLSLSGPLQVAELKTLRLRLLAIAGRLTRSGRRTQLRLDRRWPWAATVAAAVATRRAFPDPG
jgi:hypothetical protein